MTRIESGAYDEDEAVYHFEPHNTITQDQEDFLGKKGVLAYNLERGISVSESNSVTVTKYESLYHWVNRK